MVPEACKMCLLTGKIWYHFQHFFLETGKIGHLHVNPQIKVCGMSHFPQPHL